MRFFVLTTVEHRDNFEELNFQEVTAFSLKRIKSDYRLLIL